MRQIDVSVVIPCHNNADELSLALEAFLRQRNAPPFELIIVDNRSTDDLEAVIAAWRTRLPELRLVRASTEKGASYARNVGASVARSSLLMFCDADDVVSETWVSQGVRNFEDADLWSGSALPVDEKEFGFDISALRRRIGDDDEWRPLVDDQKSAFPILMGGNFGITRALYVSLGGFDQSLPSAGEDNEFAVRARRAGHRIPVSPTTRIAYRVRSGVRESCRRQFRAAVAHGLIATRFEAWPDSPFPHWTIAIARAGGALMLMLCIPSRRDWPGLAGRFSVAAGLLVGTARYRYCRRVPSPILGRGLVHTEMSEEGA